MAWASECAPTAYGPTQPAFSLARIARGDFDAYLTSWARAAAAWGHPLRLRLAQEMNGTSYPWSDGHNGNARGSFVKAWRHVVGVFTAHRATNVTWVWSPNVPFAGSTPLSTVFPGDRVVGEVALDGCNWATLQPGSRWTSFAGVFADGIAQLGRLSKRPISIGEVGCPEAGGDKATWTAAMWRTLASWHQVRGVMFFSFDKEVRQGGRLACRLLRRSADRLHPRYHRVPTRVSGPRWTCGLRLCGVTANLAAW